MDDALRELPDWLAALPAINASLNGLSTVLLIGGMVLIKADRRTAHRNVMLSAFLVSVVFLGCYLTYHQGLHEYTGTHGKSFSGTGALKAVYFTILISHVILAAVVPILAVMTIVRGLKAERAEASQIVEASSSNDDLVEEKVDLWMGHRKLAKLTFPIWLYVSVTGVVIYLMLYHLPVETNL